MNQFHTKIKLKTIIFSLLLSFLSSSLFAAEMVVTGIYQGTNLYIENPQDESGIFCITELLINDELVESIPKKTAFELDLSHLEEGKPITIKIFHHTHCQPRLLNPNAIQKKGFFEFVKIDADQDFLSWETTGESLNGVFYLLKFEHNEWKNLKVLPGKESDRNNLYQAEASHHSGVNRYKIKYLENSGKIHFSNEMVFEAENEKVTFYPKRVNEELNFSHPVKFRILDKHGKEISKGNGIKVDCKNLNSGMYYVCFDNQTEKFFKK
ncbi:T9SS type A sorting domain-containing protein [Sediminitomix flava]|uniref:Secreted protein (Por secretion system target) n=1 Tax=Sediminitomix flava TaxID=379075 RepID=A0A315ZF01_SEDFL|nr:hypothetical protein [Sediminitomix flava]PWJ44135.1 hypothetical protein BC781_101485 [Sediminitomix flava]